MRLIVYVVCPAREAAILNDAVSTTNTNNLDALILSFALYLILTITMLVFNLNHTPLILHN